MNRPFNKLTAAAVIVGLSRQPEAAVFANLLGVFALGYILKLLPNTNLLLREALEQVQAGRFAVGILERLVALRQVVVELEWLDEKLLELRKKARNAA